MDTKAFRRALEALRRLGRDQRVQSLRIDVRSVDLGLSQLHTLQAAIGEVRRSGTFVEVYLSSSTDAGLLLSTAASSVVMSPGAELILTGHARPVRFYGKALAAMGVTVDLESAGAYKSFGEVYTRPLPTPQNREATDALLGDLHRQWLETVAAGRSTPVERLQDALASSPLSANEAKELGLIDRVGYERACWDAWEERFGRTPVVVGFERYARVMRWLELMPRLRRRRKNVTVLHLEGPVVERRGQMPRGGPMITSDDVVPVLDDLIKDDRVDGVVLSINSPGGSALASDLIAERVRALNAVKPVVASMGNIAASGGYYIAAPTREIWAHPATVTGSIGVVGGKVVLGPALARLGIQTTWMGPGSDPGMMSPDAPFSPSQRGRFRASLTRVYSRFIDVVAQGRGLTPDEVEPVAQGRVWTGQQALEHRLVDRMGSLEGAVARVAELASGRPDAVRVRSYWFNPPRLGALTQALSARSTTSRGLVNWVLGADDLALEMVYSGPLEPLALSVDAVGWSP